MDDRQRRFLRNLRAFREECGFSLEEAAVRAQISVSMLSKLEAGHRKISADHWSALAEVYGRPTDDFNAEFPPPVDKAKVRAVRFMAPAWVDPDILARAAKLELELNEEQAAREELRRLKDLKGKTKK
jgi:transcriptional regulator with XRE-family HTH domain